MSGNFTQFDSKSSGAGADSQSYLNDVFPDWASRPTNNSGLGSTTTTNPRGAFFNDITRPRFRSKTYWVKSVVLEKDPSKFVNPTQSLGFNHSPTYRIVFENETSELDAYIITKSTGVVNVSANGINTFFTPDTQFDEVINNPNTPVDKQSAGVVATINELINKHPNDRKFISLTSSTNGNEVIGITSKAIQVALITNFSGSSWNRYCDASSQSFSSESNFFACDNAPNNLFESRFNRLKLVPGSSSEQTFNIHNWEFYPNYTNVAVGTAQGPIKIFGIVLFFNRDTVDLPPGTFYLGKTRTTVSGSTQVNTPSLIPKGGNITFLETNAGMTLIPTNAYYINANLVGSSGQNSIGVDVGKGSSFRTYDSIVSQSTATPYYGTVQNISIDTLTVFPTLSTGLSFAGYVGWNTNTSLAIDPTKYEVIASFDIGNYASMAAYGTAVFGITGSNFKGFTGGYCWSGNDRNFIQIEGNFQAAEVEFRAANFNANRYIGINANGVFGNTALVGSTGALNNPSVVLPVFKDSYVGWNTVVLGPATGASQIGLVKLYRYKSDPGITSIGQVARLDVNADALPRNPGSTFSSIGTYKRIYADEVSFDATFAYDTSSFTRQNTTLAAGNIEYQCVNTSLSFGYRFYGQNFALIGRHAGGGSLRLDGTAVGTSMNTYQSVATEGFHLVEMSPGANPTSTAISAFEWTSKYGELEYLMPIKSQNNSFFKRLRLPPADGLNYVGQSKYETPIVYGLSIETREQADGFMQIQRSANKIDVTGQITMSTFVTSITNAFRIELPYRTRLDAAGIQVYGNWWLVSNAASLGFFGGQNAGVLYGNGSSDVFGLNLATYSQSGSPVALKWTDFGTTTLPTLNFKYSIQSHDFDSLLTDSQYLNYLSFDP